jgi:hypothetical protein
MIFELVEDVADALAAMPARHARQEILSLPEEAIRRDIHFIERPLRRCSSVCWWYDCPDAAKRYVEPDGGWKEPPPWQSSGPCSTN